jgi:AGZA family xanthine/uracil permease-like MFS transporter
MAYIFIVNPKILKLQEFHLVLQCGNNIIRVLRNFSDGNLCQRPFAIAPYMGENAFIAYTVVNVLGYSWQTAIGAILIGGILFTIITLLKLRSGWQTSILTR